MTTAKMKYILVYASTGNQCFAQTSEFKSKQAAQKYLNNSFGFGLDTISIMTEKQQLKKYPGN